MREREGGGVREREGEGEEGGGEGGDVRERGEEGGSHVKIKNHFHY